GGSSFQVVVTVNPSPKVVFSKANQVICSGTNSEVVGLTSLTTGNVTFEWTSNAPTGIIGAAASGTNSIPVQTLENTSNLPLDVIYLAKGKLNNGEICEGDNFEYRITVNPMAKVNPVADVKLCDTETSAAINFGSNVLGATFEWTNDLLTIGLASSGSGILPGFKASNLGITPISAHITVTPKANGCVGTPSVFSITINPTPTVDKPVDQSVCNSFNTTDIKFTGNIATTIYNWKNDNPTIGLGANGTGDIPAFKATNEGATSVKATITVTPSVDGCPGLPKTFTITVNPSPVFTSQPTSSSVCLNGLPTALSVGYKNGTGVPKYEWYSNSLKSEVGSTLIATEINSIYIPPASSIGTIYYYCVVTLPSAGCSSLTSDFATVTINSLPTINLQPTSTQSICVGGTIAAALKVSYTGGVGTPIYKWYSNNTPSTTGGTAIANTNYPEYTPSTFVGVGKFYYYCEVNLSGNGCVSTVSHAAEVVLVPDPVVTQQALSAQTLCQDATADSLTIKMSGGVGDYDYQWYSNGVNSIIGGTLLTGQNIKSYLPSTANVGKMYYYCIVTQPNGPGCNATSEISVVKVNLAPTFVTQPQSSTVCKGETPSLLSVTYKDGVGTPTYQWYINSVNDRTSGLVIDKETNATYAPQFSVVGTSYYYCIITLPTGGCSSLLSEVATVVVNQYPVISSFDELIVSGTSFAVNPLNTASDIVPVGTTYTWTAPTVVPANSITGTSASAGAQTSVSSQLLTNEIKAVGIVTYTVTPRSGDCVGADFKVVVTVNPPISPNVTVTDISCFGANNGIITTNIEGGIPPYKISWFGPNGFTSDKTSISGLEKGNYMLNILDNSSIGFGMSLKIVEPTDIVLQTDFEKDITCNGAANGEIGITVQGGMGGYKYSWTKDNVAFATTKDIDSLSPGEYTVAVTDINNCGPNTNFYNNST
ncbi:MAG: PKD-like domain-containing protein, partial [Paludibacter sp.]